MQIEGEFYTLRDAEGKEVRVHVDKGTNMDKGLRIGDIVEVQRTLPGHAVSIKRASGPLAKPPSSASSGMGLGASEGGIKDTQVPTLYQAQAPGTGDYYASLIGQHDTQWYFLGKPG